MKKMLQILKHNSREYQLEEGLLVCYLQVRVENPLSTNLSSEAKGI